MKIAGSTCLVTGGAGFIGSHLVDALARRGCKVRVLDNLVNGKPENLSGHFGRKEFELIQGSVTDPLDVQRVVRGVTVVFHLACLGVRHSISHPYENHRVNAEGSLLVLDAAHREKVERFIYCSSSEVYGTAHYVPMPESHHTRPSTIYGASKLAGEAYARAYHHAYGMATVIVRPFNTYGPRSHHEGDAGEMIPKSIVRALNEKPIMIFGDGAQTRDLTYVDDIARALVAAAESDNMVGQTLNIGSDFEISIKEIAERISNEANNAEAGIVFLRERPGDVFRLCADSQKFTSLCGWEPKVTFDDGLRKTIDFFRHHPLGLKRLMEEETGRNWEEGNR